MNTKKLNELMEEKGLSQTDFAYEIGISQQMMNFICRGVKDPSLNVLKRIAERLECTIDCLV